MIDPRLRLLRPAHYVKNIFVLLPLFFSGQIFAASALLRVLGAFFAFCLASSVIYILNDIRDAEKDRRHPQKRQRPIAAGLVSPAQGRALAAGLLVPLLLVLAALGQADVAGVIGAYLVLNLFYVYRGKKMAVVDVCCIAVGFVLRVLAGSLSVPAEISPWMVMMVFLLAVFVALGKRWDDLRLLEKGAENGERATSAGELREALNGYSRFFVLSAMTFLSALNTLAYIMYTLTPENMLHYGSPWLYLTAFWVLVGNLRYLQIALVEQGSMSPVKILLRDRGIQVCVISWLVHLFCLLYI